MSEDLRTRAARSLLSTLPFVMRNLGIGMRASGGEVTPPQHRLLSIIAAHPRTLSQVADVQGVTPATATTLITTLENRGWVRRDHDPEDRRRVVVTITAHGEDHLAAAQVSAERAITDALGPLTDEQLSRLLDGLSVLDDLRARPADHAASSCATKPHKENGSETR